MTAQGHTQVSGNKNNYVKDLVGHLKCVLFLEQIFFKVKTSSGYLIGTFERRKRERSLSDIKSTESFVGPQMRVYTQLL